PTMHSGGGAGGRIGLDDEHGGAVRLVCFVECAHDFVFQADDGIRGLIVTGVQTCDLPISLGGRSEPLVLRRCHLSPACQKRCAQIGRASCREREQSGVEGGSVKKKHVAREGARSTTQKSTRAIAGRGRGVIESRPEWIGWL